MSNAIHIALGGDDNVASDGIAILFTLFQDDKAIIGNAIWSVEDFPVLPDIILGFTVFLESGAIDVPFGGDSYVHGTHTHSLLQIVQDIFILVHSILRGYLIRDVYVVELIHEYINIVAKDGKVTTL